VKKKKKKKEERMVALCSMYLLSFHLFSVGAVTEEKHLRREKTPIRLTDFFSRVQDRPEEGGGKPLA